MKGFDNVNNDFETRLLEPFPAADLEWRVGRTTGTGGFMFPYITSRGIQKRLDSVFGMAGWSTEYKEIDGGFLCKLSCLVDDHWIAKEDGSGKTDIEAVKGGISGALKRAAVNWGMGRYLYDLPQVYVELENKKFKGKIILPDWALPENERTGNSDIKVVYNNAAKIEMSYDDACEVVVTKDKFNSGKKMRDVPKKSLGFIAKFGATPEEKAAAQVILDHDG